ncbi:4-phosphopantetheinyl transferase [Ceraceosorus bombacis]|uniref:4-phosphopantetheinyl transferase n=1 Tax=Ceraceosorus bombacis TaxID=401625 RepID=A0A0P1BS56_9BASI|nr:4-phosphopantetheinyl transferase [Ceraceosorus bombacis]
MSKASIVGIGVDLLSFARLQKLASRSRVPDENAWHRSDRLASRILSTEEYEDWRCLFLADLGAPTSLSSTEKPLRWLGLRWAAKEAAYKATFPIAVASLRWKHFSVSQSEKGSGRPTISLSHLGRDQATKFPLFSIDHSALEWHLSVSHDAGLIIATVLLERASHQQHG